MSKETYLEGARKVYDAMSEHGLESHLIKIMASSGTLVSWSTEVIGEYTYNRTDADIFDDRRRARQSFQRMARRVLKISHEDVSDQRLDAIAATVRAKVWDIPEPTVTVYRGEDVKEWYGRFGSYGIGSCMSGEENEYCQLYADNPDIVGMAVLTASLGDSRNARPVARALVWDLPDGTRLMDRDYSYASEWRRELYKWRDQEGYSRRENMSYPDEDCHHVPFYDEHDNDLGAIEILMNCPEGGSVPYTDSFHFAVEDRRATSGEVVISNDLCEDHRGRLNSCHGDWPDSQVVACTCGELVDRYRSFNYNRQYYCESCRAEAFTRCAICRDWRPTETSIETLDGHTVCSRCVDNNRVYSCASCRGQVRHHVTVISATGRSIKYCADCAEEIADTCTECGEKCREPAGLEGGAIICMKCVPAIAIKCGTCGQWHHKRETSIMGECPSCSTEVLQLCGECGDSYNGGHMRAVAHSTHAQVCARCARSTYSACNACGHLHANDTYTIAHNDRQYSTDCYCLPEGIPSCTRCDALIGEGGYRVEGGRVCRTCYHATYAECVGCGTTTTKAHDRRREGRTLGGNHRHYCPACAAKAKQCDTCGILIRRGRGHTRVGADGWKFTCSSCTVQADAVSTGGEL